jgi:pullulanase
VAFFEKKKLKNQKLSLKLVLLSDIFSIEILNIFFKTKKNLDTMKIRFAPTLLPFLFLITSTMIAQNTPNFLDEKIYPTYEGDDLGVTFSGNTIAFRVWSPTASRVILRLYKGDFDEKPEKTIEMIQSERGTWRYTGGETLKGMYYTFQATIDGKDRREVPDPQAKAVGANGRRGQIVSAENANPDGWATDKSPKFGIGNDAILYELHVRDASIQPESGIQNRGRFLGLTEKDTKTPNGISTGLSHIKSLGVTHVHLLPSFDYASVDEVAKILKYNWGYDPMNFNAPEGSYATNASDAATRVREFKTLVKTFHENELRVVMDVVYNHVFKTEDYSFEALVPGYFFRQKADGTLSNASGCGNETASERPMVRKYILESVKYWVENYHVDGFRFDLMAIHDLETMNLIARELRKIKPDIILYGEGWTAGDSPLPEANRALKKHANRLEDVAVFSDDIRDGLKGSVFEHKDKGFVSGKTGMEESIKFGIVAATQHPQIDYAKVNYSKESYAANPNQTIAYSECHDNHTLWDRFLNSNPTDSEAERIKMYQLANVITLTSQAIPFLHAGQEFFRTKNGVENSFDQPDNINLMDWTRKEKYIFQTQFLAKLIQLRKNHPAFRMKTSADIAKHLSFFDKTKLKSDNVVGYQISGNANGDKWKNIIVIYNANKTPINFDLPEGRWFVALNGAGIMEKGIGRARLHNIKVNGLSAMILFQR